MKSTCLMARVAALCLILLTPTLASGAVIQVGTVSDAIAMDNRCTLREAVIAANTDMPMNDCIAGDGHDVIELFFTSDHAIAVAGSNEDQGLTGDFDIRDDLTIRPEDPSVEVAIDGMGLDRIFEVFDGADLTLERIRLQGGDVIGFGGGVFTQEEESVLTLTSARVSNCVSTLFGGGIFGAGPVMLNRSRVTNNESAFGAGIYMSSSSPLTLVDSRVDGNDSTNDGGGASVLVLHADGSTISGNEAGRHGGGIDFRSGGDALDTSYLVNTTLAENGSAEHGGALYVNTAGAVELYNVTVAWNGADFDGSDNGDGGGLFVAGGEVRPRNSIFASNSDLSAGADPSVAPNCSGPVSSQGFNLFAEVDFADCVITGSTSTDINGSIGGAIDARLECLGTFGGPTPTAPPLAESVVLDRGDSAGCSGPSGPLAVDQQGNERVWDGPDVDDEARCDMGAVEFGAPLAGSIFVDGFESGDTSAWPQSVAGGAAPQRIPEGGGECNKLWLTYPSREG